MRCFYVLVHGRMRWTLAEPATDEIGSVRPAGFYCHRYVLARNEEKAAEEAFRRVCDNLGGQFSWWKSGAVSVELEAEEVSFAPIHKLLKPENRGHTFYSSE